MKGFFKDVFFHLADPGSSSPTVSPPTSFPFCITKESIKIIILNYSVFFVHFAFQKSNFIKFLFHNDTEL